MIKRENVGFFFFFGGIGFELGASHLLDGALHLESLHQSFLVLGFFKVGFHELFSQADFCLISASQVTRITGMSHLCLAEIVFLNDILKS
jgi:hypothetical protein